MYQHFCEFKQPNGTLVSFDLHAVVCFVPSIDKYTQIFLHGVPSQTVDMAYEDFKALLETETAGYEGLDEEEDLDDPNLDSEIDEGESWRLN